MRLASADAPPEPAGVTLSPGDELVLELGSARVVDAVQLITQCTMIEIRRLEPDKRSEA